MHKKSTGSRCQLTTINLSSELYIDNTHCVVALGLCENVVVLCISSPVIITNEKNYKQTSYILMHSSQKPIIKYSYINMSRKRGYSNSV